MVMLQMLLAEVGTMLRNPIHCFPTDRSVRRVDPQDRPAVMSEELPFDRQRIRDSAFCITVLSAGLVSRRFWEASSDPNRGCGSIGLGRIAFEDDADHAHSKLATRSGAIKALLHVSEVQFIDRLQLLLSTVVKYAVPDKASN